MRLDDILQAVLEEEPHKNWLSEDKIDEVAYGFDIIDMLMFSKNSEDIVKNVKDLVFLASVNKESISFYINNFFEAFLDNQNLWEHETQHFLNSHFQDMNFELIKSLDRTDIASCWEAFIDVLLYSGMSELILDEFSELASRCFNLRFFDDAVDENELSDTILSYYIRLIPKVEKSTLNHLFGDPSARFLESLPIFTRTLVEQHPELIAEYMLLDLDGTVRKALCKGLTNGEEFYDALFGATLKERQFLLKYGF